MQLVGGPARGVNGIATLLLLGSAIAQDFSAPGPFSVNSVARAVGIVPTVVPKAVTVDVNVTYPVSGNGSFPVIFMFNGFQAKAGWYGGIVSQVASWGYVVMQYTLQGPVTIVNDREELGYLSPLLSWLAAEAAVRQSPLCGLPDLSRLATMGHSRGGKLAALHYAGSSDIATAVLFDPVDNTAFTPESADYPSASKALAAAGTKSAGVVGAGVSGSCNPLTSNYRTFYDSVAPGTWQLVINQAGHMQFARSGNAFRDWGLDLLCGKGKTSAEEVIRHAGAFAVAWLESTFRPDEAQAGLSKYREWISSQQSSGVVGLTIKTASAS